MKILVLPSPPHHTSFQLYTTGTANTPRAPCACLQEQTYYQITFLLLSYLPNVLFLKGDKTAWRLTQPTLPKCVPCISFKEYFWSWELYSYFVKSFLLGNGDVLWFDLNQVDDCKNRICLAFN